MAGIGVGGQPVGRKALDSDINMIPMIDLLLVTVSFLLLTAVWSHMARLDANAKVPSEAPPPPCASDCGPEKELHVDMRFADKFVLSWRQGGVVLSSLEVERKPTVRQAGAGKTAMEFGDLEATLEREWQRSGEHRVGNGRDRAVLHTANGTRYEEMIAVMDAIHGVSRPLDPGRAPTVTAYSVVLATN
jgi:biopolymer transport protein ExbD